MKKLALAAALALGALATAPGMAAAVSNTLNVTINLTSACKLSTISDVTFNYTAFQAAAQAGTGGAFTLQCTKGLTHTMGLVLGTGAGPGTTSVTTTDNVVDLAYTVSTPAVTAATGAAISYNIGATMGANQAGNCATGTCTNGAATNKAYTLYVTY